MEAIEIVNWQYTYFIWITHLFEYLRKRRSDKQYERSV